MSLVNENMNRSIHVFLNGLFDLAGVVRENQDISQSLVQILEEDFKEAVGL